jgi:hypothetical protein
MIRSFANEGASEPGPGRRVGAREWAGARNVEPTPLEVPAEPPAPLDPVPPPLEVAPVPPPPLLDPVPGPQPSRECDGMRT